MDLALPAIPQAAGPRPPGPNRRISLCHAHRSNLRYRMTRPSRRANPARRLPPVTDWRTTDADEILKRQLRAREERPRIVNLAAAHPSSSFQDQLAAATLTTRSRSATSPAASSPAPAPISASTASAPADVEAVLLHVARRHRPEFAAARRGTPSPRVDVVPDRAAGRLRVERNLHRLPPRLRARFDGAGLQLPDRDPADLAAELAAATLPQVRVSLDATAWLAAREHALDRLISRRDFQAGVAAGRHPAQETLLPLFPYQREGMLHLAFTERALLADEMGLGKTIQAIAACALLTGWGRPAAC